MQNKDMKKAFIKTILESSPLKTKPNFIDNFLKSKMQLKGKKKKTMEFSNNSK